jgi:RNA polymerase sigma-70 factor (ECF subfamily)
MTVETFKIEVLPLKNKLYRFAKRLMINYAEAEDVVQEVFLRLWSKREQLNEVRSIEALAVTITKNLCLDKLKSKSSKNYELKNYHEQATTITPYTAMETSDSYKKVNELINQLPDQQKMIIHLRDIEGYEYEEIAEMTGMNPNAIRVNLSRARKKIRDLMEKTYDYGYTKN